MDSKQVEALLEKYWRGETSLAEEKVIRQFFSFGKVPAHLEAYRALFAEEEMVLNPGLGPDFDRKIMDKIAGRKKFVFSGFLRVAAIALVLVALGVAIYRNNRNTARQVALQEDTYQDPKQALEETKKAFAMIAVAFRKGSAPAEKLSKFDEANEKLAKMLDKVQEKTPLKNKEPQRRE